MVHFDHAPAESGAGTIRTSDDTLGGRVIRKVWKGEDLFSPELFRYFSGQFLNALQTAFETPVNNMDTGFAYNTPDDVFRTALETNLYHFSAAKTLAEVQELNRILRESGSYAEFRRKAEKVAKAFNDTWQRTEYDTAVLTAESTVNYRRLKNEVDVFPYWEYLTVGDSKVRKEHRALHGLILSASDKLWDKIYPPLSWNCRCHVRGRMDFQVEGVDFEEMHRRVEKFFQTKEWKTAVAQGWGVNRCDTAQIFTAGQMYIRKFPEHSASYLKKLTADRWKLPTVQKMKQEAQADMPPRVERDAERFWEENAVDGRISLTDYDGRTVVIDREQFFSHTTGKGRDNRIWLWNAMLDVLQNPDEVWLNDEIKPDDLDTYCLMKFYRDEVVAVNYRIEGEELVLKTWYIMQTNLDRTIAYMKKKIWDRRRRGLLVKKTLRHVLASVRSVKGSQPVVPRQSGLDSRCYAPTWDSSCSVLFRSRPCVPVIPEVLAQVHTLTLQDFVVKIVIISNKQHLNRKNAKTNLRFGKTHSEGDEKPPEARGGGSRRI